MQTAREQAAPRFDRDLALNALLRHELDQLAADVRAAMPPDSTAAITNADPRRSKTVRWKMFELLQKGASARAQAIPA